MTRLLGLLLLAASCASAQQPLDRAAERVGAAVRAPLTQAITAAESVLPATPPPPPVTECRREAARLVVRWEVTSRSYFERFLQFPIWPQGASGITWGIGNDGGHQTARVIRKDWHAHPHVERLATTAGIIGTAARDALPRYLDIRTGFDYSMQVFTERTLVEYERRARRAFGPRFDQLRPRACAGLVSLVYNRGASMEGDSRREMKAIRDRCMPTLDYACIAAQIRAMERLWRGTPVHRGLSARREDEARLIESP